MRRFIKIHFITMAVMILISCSENVNSVLDRYPAVNNDYRNYGSEYNVRINDTIYETIEYEETIKSLKRLEDAMVSSSSSSIGIALNIIYKYLDVWFPRSKRMILEYEQQSGTCKITSLPVSLNSNLDFELYLSFNDITTDDINNAVTFNRDSAHEFSVIVNGKQYTSRSNGSSAIITMTRVPGSGEFSNITIEEGILFSDTGSLENILIEGSIKAYRYIDK